MMKYFSYIVFLGIVFSCSQSEVIETSNESSLNTQTSFSPEKVKLAGIQTGQIEERVFSDKINCKGFIEVPPQKRAKVSVPMQGFVKSILIHNGEYVQKNETILTLEHIDYIKLQKEFLSVKSNYEYLSKDFKRQEKLHTEGAINDKVFEKTLAEFQQSKAGYNALSKELELININPVSLRADNITAEVEIKAPIKGNVNEILVTKGEYLSPEKVILEIIDNTEFHIELQVFERDIRNIHKGQVVSFDCSIPESKQTIHTAKIKNIGSIVDPITKTIKVHAIPDNYTIGMRHGIFINAQVHLSDIKRMVLPSEAVIQQSDSAYVFIVSSDTLFTRKYVQTGLKSDKYIEIVSPNLSDELMVLKGVNYIYAELLRDE